MRHSASPAATRTPKAGSVPASTKIGFQVDLKLRNAARAAALAKAVSTPKSSRYGHFLTAKQWEARFSPSAKSVAKVRSFLRREGFAIGRTSADRMEVSATGTASRIESAFRTSLSLHQVQGQVVRVADTNLSVPRSLGAIVGGVTGVNETLDQTDHKKATTAGNTPATSGPFPPPAGYRSAPQCSSSFGGPLGTPPDTTIPTYGSGYPTPVPWAVCGYVGSQLRSAYGIDPANTTGSGVTVAIVDAYADPHLGSDLQTYITRNDSSYPLRSTQFSELLSKSYTIPRQCSGNGWYGEQNLDVDSVHNMAPGANLLYVGAQSCSNADLNDALRTVIDGGLAQVVSDSWGSTAGDLTESATDRQATDQILEMAAGTGISVLFASGDNGDDFTTIDHVAADYPASSPYATAVGGTSLAIGSDGARTGEWGWSTARSWLCNSTYVALGGCSSSQEGTWLPIGLALDGGSGGGTSVSYPQPPYQAGVVPSSLSEAAGSGGPMRVEPDISMDADPATGELIGQYQTFPDGSYYDQYRLGGTSLATPLFAGLLANAIQAHGGTGFGLVNPALYTLYKATAVHTGSSAIDDILPPAGGKMDQYRADYANSIDTTDGMIYSTRIIDYEGTEQYCPAKGHKSGPTSACTQRQVALNTGSGYDNMTGLGSAGTGLVTALGATH
ncbi:MAG TPA: S53 family peptidase [Solirubrobacteraceae bacterium]|nr:S53 family peptidase [Solirubrobacteraceae bacterium]